MFYGSMLISIIRLANNTKVTGDHKGVSQYLFERAMQTDATAAPGFVAAFSQGTMGDVTPNVLGAWCDDGSGQQCSFDKSTCNGNAAVCHGRGTSYQPPGRFIETKADSQAQCSRN